MINELKIGDKVRFTDLFCALALYTNSYKDTIYSSHTRIYPISYISSDYVIAGLYDTFLVLNYDKIIRDE